MSTGRCVLSSSYLFPFCLFLLFVCPRLSYADPVQVWMQDWWKDLNRPYREKCETEATRTEVDPIHYDAFTADYDKRYATCMKRETEQAKADIEQAKTDIDQIIEQTKEGIEQKKQREADCTAKFNNHYRVHGWDPELYVNIRSSYVPKCANGTLNSMEELKD